MRPFLVLSFLVLAACGAEGPPIQPGQSGSQPGLTVSGQVQVGVVGR